MDGVHDLGGREGYGPIDVHESGEPFHADWEARLFGIVRAMTRTASWSIDWFRQCRELIDPADYLTRPYYDQWLQTYAAMMVDSGVATVAELASGRSSGSVEGLAPPKTAASVEAAKRATARFDRDTSDVPRFVIGQEIVTRRDGSPGHTRFPQYVRGRRGRIESLNGSHILPDSNARGKGRAEALYTVSFSAAELWPEASGRPDRIFLDLWESYFERA